MDKDDVLKTGQVLVTIVAMLEINEMDLLTGLFRHRAGDWGDDELVRHYNEKALANGGPIRSRYRDGRDQEFWVHTVTDRSVTVIYRGEGEALPPPFPL